jgi:hypothetical protein
VAVGERKDRRTEANIHQLQERATKEIGFRASLRSVLHRDVVEFELESEGRKRPRF